ncbi:MAG: cell division protein ZapA [Lachnospiraceae bacterium]|jgi:cell division protein ZapA (FtsZ GTPase activity inhibitor)|nr:cell division protein ZapA [Lachnospiraceae bacterium]
METKKYTDVYIAGKVYTLGGFEEEEYLQKVAAYVNTKVSELRGQSGYLRLAADYQNVLLEMNLADDVFKMRRQVAAAEKKLSTQEKETYNVKHDLVTAQMKVDALTEKLEETGQELASVKEELASSAAELHVVKEELAAAKKDLEEADLEKEIAEEEQVALSEELKKAKKRIAELEERQNRRH